MKALQRSRVFARVYTKAESFKRKLGELWTSVAGI
jgi:hypothetical protein